MRLFNTLSGKKEDLSKPVKGAPLRIFVCGPTVYDSSHIGHARTYLVFDAFVKYLRSQGMKIRYLQNITDIDDKIIARAQEEKKTTEEIAALFSKAHMYAMRSLGVDAVDIYAPATNYIPEIIAQVKTLKEKGFAYEISDDGIYFDISKFKDYGRLARRTALQAEDATSRIDESVEKRNKGDFALWKFSKPNEPKWESELGAGRPGWHIEDTAIAFKELGEQYELHGGAVDLKFPHHEAEIAQAEAISGKKPYVQIWLHTGFLTVNGEKMSKSLKNFITVKDFLKEHSPRAMRLMVLSHHYRSPLNYTDSLVNDYEKSVWSLMEFFGKLELIRKHRKRASFPKLIDPIGFTRAFHKALDEDFNTPQAIAAVFEFVNRTQPKIWNLGPKSAEVIHGALKSALKSLGFTLEHPKTPRKVEELVKEREKSRKNKQFAHSDALRQELFALGYVVEDTPIGPFAWPKANH